MTDQEKRRDHLTRRDIEIAERAAESAIRKHGPTLIRETLTGLGIDARDPIATQESFSYLRRAIAYEKHPDTPAKRAWVDKTWRRCERVKSLAFDKITTIGLTVVAGLIAAGFAVKHGIKLPW